MFLRFFYELKQSGIPVSVKEYLTFLEAVDSGIADKKIDNFYYLSRASLVKDERHLDKFDRVFGHVFRGLESLAEGIDAEIPEEWLRALAERLLTEEEKAQIKALGGWDKIMEELKKRLAEQKGRHEGGSKWIGTGGTSPFGAYGYNPEGVRIGQDGNRNFRAVKVWDRRDYKDLDGEVELGTRNIKLALRRLRRFARQGAADELDLDSTIKGTAHKGYLDIAFRPERRNTMKVLAVLRYRRLNGFPHPRVRGAVFRRALRVQAHGLLLLPQLPVRERVAEECAPLGRARSDLGGDEHLSSRL